MAVWAEPRRLRAVETAPQAVSAVLRLEACAGADEELETLLRDLAAAVHADEPDCLSYAPSRQIGSRAHFAVHVRFASMEAFNAHAETAHMDRLLPRIMALLAAPVAMEIFLEL